MKERESERKEGMPVAGEDVAPLQQALDAYQRAFVKLKRPLFLASSPESSIFAHIPASHLLSTLRQSPGPPGRPLAVVSARSKVDPSSEKSPRGHLPLGKDKILLGRLFHGSCPALSCPVLPCPVPRSWRNGGVCIPSSHRFLPNPSSPHPHPSLATSASYQQHLLKA